MTSLAERNDAQEAESGSHLVAELDLAGRRPRSRKLLVDYGGSVLLALAILGVWQIAVVATHTPSYVISTPTQDVSSLLDNWSLLGPALLVTSEETALGFLISVVAGIGIAVVLHFFPMTRRATYPLLLGSQAIPIVVLAPVLVIMLGYGIQPKLVIVALFCFFPIVINGLAGLRSTDDEFIKMMRTLHASRWDIFLRVQFPGALPSMFAGLRIAATYASIGAVFGEWAGSNAGLGYVISESTPNLLTARIFAAVFLLTAMSLALFGLVALLERVLVPWAPRGDAVGR